MMGKVLQYKTISAAPEIKSEGANGGLRIRAYACAFGNVDSYRDVIVPTACDAFLACEESKRMKLCHQHDMSQVIGVITDKGVDECGMWFEADLIPTTVGRDAIMLIKAGALNEFSIGYYADEWHDGKMGGVDVRYLDAITIAEVSLVTRAANPRAILLDAKGEGVEKSLKTITDKELEALKQMIENEYAGRVLARI